MLRKTLTIVTAGAFAFMSVAPAALAEPSLIPGPNSSTYDLHMKPAKVAGGAYVRVPFTGGLKREQIEEPRFGLAMAANFSGRRGMMTNFASGNNPRVLDLSLGMSSFSGQSSIRDTLQFNGMTFADGGMLYADEEGKMTRGSGTHLVIAGVIIAATAGVMIALSNSLDDECFFAETCSEFTPRN